MGCGHKSVHTIPVEKPLHGVGPQRTKYNPEDEKHTC